MIAFQARAYSGAGLLRFFFSSIGFTILSHATGGNVL